MILPATYQNGFAPRDGQPLYPSLWRGCVGAWNPGLGPSGLTLRDWSGFGNHGTLTNGPTFAASQGKYAMSFDGTDDYVETSMHIIPAGNATISCWVYTRSTVEGYFLVEWSTDNNMYVGVFSGNWIARTGDGGGGFSSLLSTAATADKWTHLSASRTSSTLTLYLNGAAMVSTSATSYQGGGIQPLRICRLGTSIYANCLISDAMIHSRALSPNEIRTLATRRGIAYVMAPRRRSSAQVTTNRRRRIIIGGNR